MSPDAGYSGTPLAKKLGYKPGMRAYLDAAPDGYAALVAPLSEGVEFVKAPKKPLDLVHVLTTSAARLSAKLKRYRPLVEPAGVIWVSWPKQVAKVPTDVTEDVVRDVALPLGLVDVKVCAVDAVWSGLKLVVRKDLRA
jgi:hypothetical protein